VENLPPEILLRIFRLVTREDLLNVCLVSKKFLAVASLPEFWREVTPTKKKIVKKNGSEEFLSLDRFKNSHSFNLYGDIISKHTSKRLENIETEETEESLRNLIEISKNHKSIKTVMIKHFNLKNIKILSLIEVVKKLEGIDLTRSSMTEFQIISLLESIPSTKSLKSINLSGIILSSIPPVHFGQVGEHLENFDFSHTLLTKDQSSSLLQGIARGKKMKSLKIADLRFSLDDMVGDLLAACISQHTEYLDLSNTKISEAGLKALINRLAKDPHSIKSLSLNNIPLSSFWSNSDTLALSLSHIPKLELAGALRCITRQEVSRNNDIIRNIVQEIKAKKKVKSIDLSLNNMSEIHQSLLVEAFSNLKNIDLSQTSLTKDQSTALLSSLSQSEELEELKLTDNDLSHVETPVLVSLVTRLKTFDLTNTSLSPDQAVAVITRGVLSKDKLRMLDLGFFKMIKIKGGFKVNLTKPGNISIRRFQRLLPFEYRRQRINSLHGIDSENSSLSVVQMSEILDILGKSRAVTAYRIYRVDLSEIADDLLVSLVLSCKDLNILKTNLSTSQLSAVFEAIQRSDTLEELEIKEENLKNIPTYQKTACVAALKSVLLDDSSNNNEQVEETEKHNQSPSEHCLGQILAQGIVSTKISYLNTAAGKVQLFNMNTGKYLTCTKLTKSELEQLFSTLANQSSVTDITIDSSDLSVVGEGILANSLARLRYLELSTTNLTPAQLSALFCLLKESSELEEIVMTRNILSHVPPEDLATTITRLRKVRLEYSYLTTEQCTQIFTKALADRNSPLQSMEFGHFGYGWMDGRVMSYNLPSHLQELVKSVKDSSKFQLEFEEFKGRRLAQSNGI